MTRAFQKLGATLPNYKVGNDPPIKSASLEIRALSYRLRCGETQRTQWVGFGPRRK
jgi:hypothetical protein